MDKQINQAIKIVRGGGVIIFPTDTAFGIGCRIDDQLAIEKLFRIRQRPVTQAPPVLFESIAQVKDYVLDIPDGVEEELMKKFWPGALTIILPANKTLVSDLVRGGGENIGCRIPDSSVCLEIIKGVGVPIIGTSANFSGQSTPYSVEELDPELVNLVDLVVPGSTSAHKESTVIDCTHKPWNILRQGAILISG